jgi:4-amino-4-deoxy-L-arabinose transferase-like glycosyltransferase
LGASTGAHSADMLPWYSRLIEGVRNHRWLIEVAFLLVLFALALFIRTYRLDLFPPGLYNDEATHGIDALAVLEGEHAVFFERNNGREPLYIYLLALVFSVSGATAYNIRLASAICGAATVATTYWFIRELFRFAPDSYWRHPRWFAAWGALFLTFSYWHITFSRIGFRAITLPLMTTIAFALVWRAWRLQREEATVPWMTAILAGIALGLTLYAYTAGRFTLPLFVSTVVVMAWMAPRYNIDRRTLWKSVALTLAASLVTALPLAIYFLSNPASFGEHAAYVSIFNAQLAGSNPLGALLRSTGKMLLMFISQADLNPRHNPAQMPVFDPLMAAWLALGIGISIVQWRKLTSIFCLLWFGFFLLPAALTAEGIPHSLRALGLIPIVYVLPLVSMAWLGSVLPQRHHAVLQWIPLPFLLISAAVGLSEYFSSLDRIDRFEAPFFVGIWELAESIDARANDGIDDEQDARTVWILPLPLGEDLADRVLYTTRFAMQGKRNLHTLFLDEATLADELSNLTRDVDTVNVLRTYGVPDLTHYDTRFMDSKGLLRLALRDNSEIIVSGNTQADVPYTSYHLGSNRDFSIPETHQTSELDFGDTVVLEAIGIEAIGVGTIGIEATGVEPNEQSRDLLPGDSVTLPGDGEIGIVLRWRSLHQLAGNLKVRLSLINPDGYLAGQVDDILAGNSFPRRPIWPANEPTSTYHVLAPYPGIPPGDYSLHITVYDEESNRVLAIDGNTPTSARLSDIQIDPPLQPLEVAEPQHLLAGVSPADGVHIVGYDLPQLHLRPGDILPLILYTQLTEDADSDVLFQVGVRNSEGRVLAHFDARPGGDRHPTKAWRVGEIYRNWFSPRLESDMPDGEYTVIVSAVTSAAGEEDSVAPHQPFELAKIQVAGHQRLFDQPIVSQPMAVIYGDLVQLIGVSGPESLTVEPGEVLTTTLIWQPLGTGDRPLVRFAQLLDDSGTLVAQEDTPPCSGECPATSWLAGEYIEDTASIELPSNLRSGRYTMITGWYDPELGHRLVAIDERGEPLGAFAATLPLSIQSGQ